MMDCFPCFKKCEENNETINNVPVAVVHPYPTHVEPSTPQPRGNQNDDAKDNVDSSDIEARSFTFRELATATKNFRQEWLLGECGFGRIYKGMLQPNGEVVSVKRLDKNKIHGNKEFLIEVFTLSLLHHSNLLNLVGYCADGDQRLLVYEFMPMGSVEGHLHDLDADKKSLDWQTRMKIACGIAEGIDYLHNKAKPPVIYRDLKCSNIMLDDDFNPKLSDYGLAKLETNNMSHMTVMGNHGYGAPEYQKHGELTLKSDVYNFGVVLLELISGRRALDTSKPADEQNIVTWAQPIFRDPKRFPEMADPRLRNSYPVKSLNQAVGIAAMCVQDEPDVRPLISDVVASLGFLAIAQPEEAVPILVPPEIEAPPHDHPAWSAEMETSPDDHLVERPPEMKAQSSKESPRYETDHSEESSEASWTDNEESFNKNHYEQKNDCMDQKSDSDSEPESEEENPQKEKEKENSMKHASSWGSINSLEYEVASMSSSSSNSDNESPLGSINKKCNNTKSQRGNSSSRMKCRSTKIHKEERREGMITGSQRSSRKRCNTMAGQGRNDEVEENENIGTENSSVSANSSKSGMENPSVSSNSIKSDMENRSVSSNSSKSGRENLSVSSNSSKSSIAGSEDGSVRSGDHKHNAGSEDEIL